jgi:hypothetical protein
MSRANPRKVHEILKDRSTQVRKYQRVQDMTISNRNMSQALACQYEIGAALCYQLERLIDAVEDNIDRPVWGDNE